MVFLKLVMWVCFCLMMVVGVWVIKFLLFSLVLVFVILFFRWVVFLVRWVCLVLMLILIFSVSLVVLCISIGVVVFFCVNLDLLVISLMLFSFVSILSMVVVLDMKERLLFISSGMWLFGLSVILLCRLCVMLMIFLSWVI